MRSSRIAALIVAVSAAGAPALAGEIYGKVLEGSAPAGEAVTLEATCGTKNYPPVKTDKSGSYRMVLDEAGKCSLKVTYKQQSASLGIASYDDAVQVDVVLEMKDGKLAARRK